MAKLGSSLGNVDGYEATLGNVFDQSPAVGVVAVGPALLGPPAGIPVGRCLRVAGALPPDLILYARLLEIRPTWRDDHP